MQAILIRILVCVVLGVALLLGGFLYGHRVASRAGAAQVAALQAAQQKALAQAVQDAAAQQEAADAARLAQMQSALAQARDAAARRQQQVQAGATTIAALQGKLKALSSQTTPTGRWLSMPIPPAVKATEAH